MPGTIRLVDPDGVERDVATDTAATVLQDPRWRLAQTEDSLGRLASQAHEADFGGAAGQVKAGLAGFARGVTLGGSDLAARAIGGDDAAIALEGLREVNPVTSFTTELTGALAPALFSGGAATPAGLAARAGRGVTAAAGGGLRGAVAGGAVEGALFGAGQGVTELSLSQEPLTLERAASAISSNALFGAAAGGVGGAAAKGVEAGLGKAKGALDDWLAKRGDARAAAEAAAQPIAPGSITAETDVATLDRKGLKIARDHELDSIRMAQQPERQAFVDDLAAARKAAKEEKSWIATQGGKTREVRELGRGTFEADQRIDRLLKVERDLVDNPSKALSALRQEEQALNKLRDWGEDAVQRFLDERSAAPQLIRDELVSGKLKLKGYVIEKGGISKDAPIVDELVDRVFAQRYGDGVKLPTNLQVLGTVPGALERNKALQDRLARLAEAPVSDRLAAIEAAEHKLGIKAATPAAPESPVGALLQAAAPFAGPLGAVASTGVRALGTLRKAAGAAAERAAQATSRFLDVAGKATSKAGPSAPLVATKVLEGVRYASRDDGPPPRLREVADPSSKLAAAYRARTDEIKGQVQVAPDGSYQMRPDARLKLAAKFDGIRPHDPVGADRLETIAARRLEYLASIIPRRPDIGGIPTGPDRWQPSDMEMRAFARSVGAVEDPQGVLDRAAAGRVVPEEAAALRAVHPELLADFTQTVIAQLPTLRKTLPYKRRLALSLLTGTPVDAAMTPAVLREIQSMYSSEPGTAGGTMAPRAQAQFGSVKRSDPGTPAQRREGITA